MSETSSESPSVHIHPISPSSSLSSNDSEPHSDPTSDEQPDLGAFNAVLREWTHLQPPPRIPVQIRSATSSTTPTFQPSITGSELRSEHSRNTRVSGFSAISSFTRPPSSSAQPEGSTVWAQAPIASYLYSLSGTPSNDNDDEESYEDLGAEGEYTPNSMASTSLTVEIESETDFDESNGRVDSSPYPFPSDSGVSGVSMLVPLQTDETRVDSRETEHLEDENEIETSATSRERSFTVTAIQSSGDTESESRLTSMQLQSQVRPTPTTTSMSSDPVIPSVSSFISPSPPAFPPNRSRNPLPPRTVSDSSFTTSGSASSSNLSLVSYQLSEAPSMPIVEEPSSMSASTTDSSSVVSASASMGLKTQQSLPTSSSGSIASLGTQRPQQPLPAPSFHPQVASSGASALSSTGSPLPNPHPLPNPYSPLPIPASEPPAPVGNTRRPMLANIWRQGIVVDDLGTPDQPPSETLLFEPPRERKPEFHPVVDDDEEDIKVERLSLHERNGSTNIQSAPLAGYTSGYDRPGPSTLAQAGAYTQTYSHFQRNDHREPHNEDEDELDLDEEEEETHRSRYTYSHGPTPRSFGPALTPRGLPSSSIDLRSQASTQTTTNTMTNSLVHPFGYSNQSLLQQSQPQQQQQPLPTQQPSIVQPQYQYQNNQQNPNVYTTTTTMPQSTNQQSVPSYPYTPRAPVATQSSSAYTSQPHAYSSSTSQYSYPPNQAQAGPEPTRNPHGYPYSLLGLHALPGTFVHPEIDELPSTSSSGVAPAARATTTTTTSQIPPRAAQTHRRAPSDPYNASFSDDNSTVHGTDPTAAAAATQVEVEVDTESILLEQAVPSLGVLDGVLSFIAVERERARNIAAREASSTAEADGSRDAGSGDDGEGEPVEGEAVEGEEEWKHAVENEPNQPKRKRRRKRPPRAHAAAAAAAQAIIAAGGVEVAIVPSDATGLEGAADHAVSILAPATTSPKRKKRAKSTPASISASTSSSLLSVPLTGDGFQTPTINKEFLVPPLSLSRSASKNRDKSGVTILRRADELLIRPNMPSDDDDSDFDGGRTPTNFDIMRAEASIGAELAALPINLTGKKGRRVGRREREREKAKHDAVGGEAELKESDKVGGGVDDSFEFDFDDDKDDDGVEPHEDEDEEQGEDNDSLSNLSLLKPPRRRRDRSRRRKGRDTNYIPTVTDINAIYQSSPGTSGGLLQAFAEGKFANNGNEHLPTDVGIKQSNVEDDDVFESKVNSTPERKKRTRTKRLKTAKSFPDLNIDAQVGGSPVLIPAPVVEDRTQLAVMKATKGRVGAAELLGAHDALDVDRNQLQKYLIASGSGIILMNSPPEPKNQPPPDSKRGRLLALARQLRELFPEQYEDLGRIIQRIEKQGATQGGKTKKTVSSDAKEDIDMQSNASKPISISGPKRRRSRKGHTRASSESGTTGADGFDHDDEQFEDLHNADGGAGHVLDIEEEEEEIDPRGRPPKRNDVLVHIFIDHSNILIGLLSHLKRHQSYRKNALNKARARPLPALISKATAATKASNQTDAASAFAAVKASSSRPLPIPSNGDTNTTAAVPVAIPIEAKPIPLPSFATMSRSLPTTSALNTYMASRDEGGHSDDATAQPERETNSDGYEFPIHANADKDESGVVDDSSSVGPVTNSKEKKAPRHLWHAALALILERGRPVTRRVVVTSSPLYQPMDAIERLGYELRVFIRVPDLGDGQDRERYRDKDKLGSGKSSGSAKSAQSSPVTTSSSSGPPLLSRKNKSIGHVRQVSGNTSTESGSGGGAGSGNASGGGNLHPYYGITNNTSQTRVKFREQGVDELLQLKLHQAIAATDDVPEGSTIVLATGDGNMGQFNEDGFLGPVRTALRRGWKVELYAWEDGLSRAWKREFGAGSEWGRRGFFRVIGMEQFAHVLVEAAEHMSN